MSMVKAMPTSRQRMAAKIAFLLFVWYISSSIAIFFTKGLLSPDNTRLPDFSFALTITATNNIVAYVFATTVSTSDERVHNDPNVRRISLLIGATTAAEIGLANIALYFFSVSFATILRGSAPLFVMVWGAAFGLLVPHLGLLVSMLAIVIGVGLAVAGESAPANLFSASAGRGLLAQLMSGFLSGLRWVLTQVFVKGEAVPNNQIQRMLNIQPLGRGLSTLETVRMTAPFTCLPLLPVIGFVEGRRLLEWSSGTSAADAAGVVGCLLCVGTSVFCLLLAEYELVKVTSSLTVSVAFVVKEILVIVADRLLFGQRLGALTWVGFVVVQAGVAGYVSSKQMATSKEGNVRETEGENESGITEKDVP